MALEGTLSDFSLADIFQLIAIQKKTGVLSLSSPDATVRVHFRDGKVVNADSVRRDDEDRLGHVLVRTGRITEDQLDEALRVQKDTLQQLGHILVSRGFLTEDVLHEALRMQVTQMVYRIFRWKEGEYHFDQDADVALVDPSFEPLSAEAVLMEGVRMLDEWPLIESRISSPGLVFRRMQPHGDVEVVDEVDGIDDDSHLRELIGGGGPREGSIQLTAHEATVYAKIDGRRTVHEILESVGLYEFDASKALYDMAERRIIIEMAPAPEAPGRRPAPPRPGTAGEGMARTIQVAALAWLVVAQATRQHNPLDYWAIPPTATMKADAFRAARLKLALEKVSLSLEAFHATTGKYPDSLDVLVAEGLLTAGDLRPPGAAPIDYHLDQGGFVLSYAKSM